jgi:hypothetical protein
MLISDVLRATLAAMPGRHLATCPKRIIIHSSTDYYVPITSVHVAFESHELLSLPYSIAWCCSNLIHIMLILLHARAPLIGSHSTVSGC